MNAEFMHETFSITLEETLDYTEGKGRFFKTHDSRQMFFVRDTARGNSSTCTNQRNVQKLVIYTWCYAIVHLKNMK